MEKGYIFHPPPFLGSGFRQNHQIRTLKTNSLPFLSSHRSLYPSSSHASPSVSLLTSRAATSFARNHLDSHRRRHLRKCWDCLHVCLQRGEWGLAVKFLKVILGAHEWASDVGWRLALVVLACTDAGGAREGSHSGGARRLAYLQQLDLNASAPFKAAHTTAHLVTEYIAANRLNDAIELLEQRVNVYPYKSQPQLHTLLGMLYVFVGVSSLFNARRGEAAEVELKALDRTTKSKARLCFETAIQATESWRRSEMGKRQRIWGMHVKDVQADGERVSAKRGRVWGRDVVQDDDWPTEEHPDVKRARRRLDGEESETEEVASDVSSASGSVWSDNGASSSDDDDTEQERGRSRTPTHLNHVDADAEEAAEDPQPLPAPSKGHKAWAASWPAVAPFYAPAPPLAHHIALHFLALLGAPSTTVYSSSAAPRAAEEEDGEDSDSGEGVVDGIQLTREEAELRLRRILFEGEPEEGAGGARERERVRGGMKVKREKRRDRRDGRGKKMHSSRTHSKRDRF
ncbi:uncharacterized protein SRS1_11015 [Sporisorium reilianum f. sp. reilianum]|uniref:Uncharacterized protein n=1 Tax=Sporisorium reilianum f. sp. reilianum TaxID=72559 RepID=A0A2N8UCN4_9BASI|nr:uncharacterized protein SRS1_11015 [Sporisorium reilianum f. sp. reilianum]